MLTLLAIAEFVCGATARHRTFDPMLADWQRELDEAHRRGTAPDLFALGSGCFGFTRALLYCAVSEGVWIPPLRASLVPIAAVTAAIAISIAVLLIARYPSNLPRDLSLPMVQSWVLVWSATFVPPVFVLATFLLRRDRHATIRHAIVFVAFAIAVTTALVINTTDEALRRRYDTFEASERMREWQLADIRAGRAVYDGGRHQRELRTTVEQRRARFNRYRAQMDAMRQDPTPTWRDRFERWSPIAMAAVFAIIGWTLAGLRMPTVPLGVGWWALMFAAIVAMTRILSYLVGVPMPRPPQWIILPIFTSIMLALVINARYSQRLESGGQR